MFFKSPSYLFHPILMGVYGTAYFFWITKDYYSNTQILYTLLFVGNITFVVPLTFFFLLLYLKKVDSLMIPNLQQRKIPLLFALVLFWFLIYKLRLSGIYKELSILFTSTFVSIIIAYISSFMHIKVSLHAIGIQTLAIFSVLLHYHFGNNDWTIPLVFLLISGWVGSSRLYMKAHSNKELLMGYVAGIIPSLLFAPFWA